MNADESPRLECDFDRSNGSWTLRYFNCGDEVAKEHAVKSRIEQIGKQLAGRSGLTNRERKNLAKELNFLQRQFRKPERSKRPHETPNAVRKMKATEKKLEWLGRKFDRESG